ncbi:hypothetical protein EG68_12069 [Paragonimus skrjabini miyazakii]|uniref:Uncharacterized protein n=1 Tax=Paragonimus skrjabini miyazakii TaxID=59628 RepID=A0A8S9YE95_9TREM|nr:hypothetical protein EG68_12069 [Paragonimus skrjabini miyazakii]
MLEMDGDALRKKTESVEQSEEAKLREKYPGLNNKASALLQRRLSKNHTTDTIQMNGLLRPRLKKICNSFRRS